MPRILAALAVCASLALARDPEWGGLGCVAASPDGRMVACGGENRVLYVVDAASHEVKQRIWIQARVGSVAFSKDGSRLCLEDDEKILHIFDTSSWKETARIPDAGECAFAPAADVAVAISSKGLRFLSMTDGSEKGTAPVEGRLLSVGIDAAGTRAVALLEAVNDPAEKKLDYAAMPKDLKGAAQKEWTQKNDGRMATLKWFEVPSGKPCGEAKTFWSANGKGGLFLDGDTAVVVVYDDANARITPKGEVTLFSVTESYNYGRGGSADGKTAIGGGLRSGAVQPAGGGAPLKFELDRLPGWPEYWAGFAPAADGSWWGVTSASRLAHIAKDGRIEWAGPVY